MLLLFVSRCVCQSVPQFFLREKSLCGGGVPSSHPSLGFSVFFLFSPTACLVCPFYLLSGSRSLGKAHGRYGGFASRSSSTESGAAAAV